MIYNDEHSNSTALGEEDGPSYGMTLLYVSCIMTVQNSEDEMAQYMHTNHKSNLVRNDVLQEDSHWTICSALLQLGQAPVASLVAAIFLTRARQNLVD